MTRKFEGKVIKYLKHKGIGVIKQPTDSSKGGPKKVRFHVSDLEVDSASVRDELRFGVKLTDEGREAVDPTVIGSAGNSNSRDATSSSTGATEARRCEGTVIKYLGEDGYGFVSTADFPPEQTESDSETTDVFFHITDFDTDTVSEDDRLKFDVVETERGLRAKRVTVVERDATDTDVEPTRTDPAERLGVSGSKDDTKYGREESTTSGDVESFEDDRKFR